MSMIVSWISPDQLLPIGETTSVVSVNIYSLMTESSPPALIATIDAQDPVTGVWLTSYEDPNGTAATFYQVSFVNSAGVESKKTSPGTGGYLSARHEFIDDVRMRLYDFNPELYRLDEPQFMWSTTQLWSFSQQGLNKINQTGPMLTNFTFENVVCTELVKDYMIYLSLKSRGILENFNQFQFNDGVGLTWDRSSKLFSSSDGTYNSLIDEIRKFKLAYRPRAIGTGTQRLPFRVLRPLSFLPNMKNVFGI